MTASHITPQATPEPIRWLYEKDGEHMGVYPHRQPLTSFDVEAGWTETELYPATTIEALQAENTDLEQTLDNVRKMYFAAEKREALLEADNEWLTKLLGEATQVLLVADRALRNHACHGGPVVPCIRDKSQCKYECGKMAGDALMVTDTTLSRLSEKEGNDG